ncbi:hypothetical protein FQN60_016493 [Etheostoma spectabile]|uniref:ZN622/Rei1/Reh1 zinc finger C2H2-type domain-containing protein n=1 Tax=Etheostoma spectabile TaxID=54343 RepID=A0A5J5D7U5_9PERO|nr:hypothetical protein FQN60_016493 [Etheostoma spectabile]
MMNEKNLEKGLGDEKVDHDARNEALQQALKEQQRPSAARQGSAEGGTTRKRAEKLEKPPRLMWLEEQAKRREGEDGATAVEGEWEDVEEEEEDGMEEEEEEEEDEEETMDQEEGDSASASDPRPPALPGSIPVTDCLFCSRHSRSLMKNIGHMTKAHSFFIPDVEFSSTSRASYDTSERRSVLETCVYGVTRKAARSTRQKPYRVT